MEITVNYQSLHSSECQGSAPNQESSLYDAMMHLKAEYLQAIGEYEKNPSSTNLEKVTAVMYRMKDFLTENKEAIFAAAKANGWPEAGPGDGYVHIYNACFLAINTFTNPSFNHNQANIPYLNEQFTQLSWLLSNPHNLQG